MAMVASMQDGDGYCNFDPEEEFQHIEGSTRPTSAARQPAPPSVARPPGRAAPRRCPLFRDPVLPVRRVAVRDSAEVEGPPGRAVSITHFKDDSRDWRKLPIVEIKKQVGVLEDSLKALEASFSNLTPQLYPHDKRAAGLLEDREGLLAAVAVGICQACSLGSHWVPGFGTSEARVKAGIRVPMSQLMPEVVDMSLLEEPTYTVPASIHVAPPTMGPIDICLSLTAERRALPQRVAVVRFTASGDKAGLRPAFRDSRAAGLFLRTTYVAALLEAPRHVHCDPIEALDSGAAVYTSDVTIVREPVEEGAAWLDESVQLDVIWVALPRHPSVDGQDQYVRIAEKAQVMERIDLVFSCAIEHGIEVLVFPPLGIGGAAGCHHPSADAGDLLHKAVMAHSPYIPSVYVCQEHPDQVHAGTWDAFSQAVLNGRPPISLRSKRSSNSAASHRALAKPTS